MWLKPPLACRMGLHDWVCRIFAGHYHETCRRCGKRRTISWTRW